MWKSVKGYEEWYEVSTLGRVKLAKDRNNWRAGRILSPGPRRGYLCAVLTKDGKRQRRSVHGLVMENFVGPCPDGKEINHIDGDKTNNRLDNLEYVTKSENILHGWRAGLYDRNNLNFSHEKGENHPTAKLCTEQVHKIRALATATPLTNREIGKMYSISGGTVSLIANRKRWSHV